MAFAAAALPIIGVVATVAGIGLQLAAVQQNTSATVAANNYQSQVLERNRALMELNAQRAVESASVQQLQQDQMTRALLGEQIAQQSASGLKLGGRSQMLTRKAARELGRLDAENIRYQGDIEALNFRQMAEDATQEIEFRQKNNGYAMTSGFLDSASVLVGGASTLAKTDFSSINSILGSRKTSPNAYSGVKSTSFRFAR